MSGLAGPAVLEFGGTVLTLNPCNSPVSIGRSQRAALVLADDDRVSARHAELVAVANEWLVLDDGLSRNGSYINGERVRSCQVLRDGDRLRVGRTQMRYRRAEIEAGALMGELARPLAAGEGLPPTDVIVAGRLEVPIPSVRRAIGALYRQHDLDGLPEAGARMRLARIALGALPWAADNNKDDQ